LTRPESEALPHVNADRLPKSEAEKAALDQLAASDPEAYALITRVAEEVLGRTPGADFYLASLLTGEGAAATTLQFRYPGVSFGLGTLDKLQHLFEDSVVRKRGLFFRGFWFLLMPLKAFIPQLREEAKKAGFAYEGRSYRDLFTARMGTLILG